MKKARFGVLFLALAILAVTSSAMATQITITNITDTSDNFITGLTINGVAITNGDKPTDWQQVSTFTPNPNPGPNQYYNVVWHIANQYGLPNMAAGNPMAFLGQVSFDAETILSGVDSNGFRWQVSTDSVHWVDAISIAKNGTSSIWYNAHGGPITGISPDAWWIGYENGGAPDSIDNYYVRLSNTPEPGTLILLGSSLAGLVVFRRKFKA